MRANMVGLQIRTLNIFTVFLKNEYSLYQSILADGSIPAVTYICICWIEILSKVCPMNYIRLPLLWTICPCFYIGAFLSILAFSLLLAHRRNQVSIYLFIIIIIIYVLLSLSVKSACLSVRLLSHSELSLTSDCLSFMSVCQICLPVKFVLFCLVSLFLICLVAFLIVFTIFFYSVCLSMFACLSVCR